MDKNEEEIPAGWKKKYSEEHGKYFYYHSATKKSTWKKPTATPPQNNNKNGANLSPSTPPVLIDSKKNQQETHSPSSSVGSMNSPKVVGGVGGKDDSSNNTNWREIYSETHKKNYYYNEVTGKTTWKNPNKTANTLRLNPPPPPLLGEEENDDGEEEDNVHNNNKAMSSQEEYQRLIMKANPALEEAFRILLDQQRKLAEAQAAFEKQRVEQLEMINKKFAELSNLQQQQQSHQPAQYPASPIVPSPLKVVTGKYDESAYYSKSAPASADVSKIANRRSRRSTRQSLQSTHEKLDKELREFSNDLQRRSLSVMSRESIKLTGGNNNSAEFQESLKQIQETANKVAKAREESGGAEDEFVKAQLAQAIEGKSFQKDVDDTSSTDEENLEQEKKDLEKGFDVALNELKLKNEAREQATSGTGLDLPEQDDDYYYTILGVKPNATDAELKKAYQRQLREWHPDKIGKDQKTQEYGNKRIEEIQRAYRTLSDSWEKEIYLWFGLEQYKVHLSVLSSFKNYLISGIDLKRKERNNSLIGSLKRKIKGNKVCLWLDGSLKVLKYAKKKIMDEDAGGKASLVESIIIDEITDVKKNSGQGRAKDCCFSIVHGGEFATEFEVASSQMCDFISTRITLLIIDLKRDQKWMFRYYDRKEDDSEEEESQ